MNSWEHLHGKRWLEAQPTPGHEMGVSSQNNSNTVYIHNTEIRIYSVGLLIGAAGVALCCERRSGKEFARILVINNHSMRWA
jgi:hypothetical protein